MSKAAGNNLHQSIGASELPDAAVHLAFNCYYFYLYNNLLTDIRITLSNPSATQAVTDALLLHARLLLAFFYRAPNHDDLCLTHFIDLSKEFEAHLPLPEKSDWVEEVLGNLHKHLAHMTATRWQEKQPEMDYYRSHFDHINDLIEKIRRSLPADLHAIFEAKWAELENRTERVNWLPVC